MEVRHFPCKTAKKFLPGALLFSSFCSSPFLLQLSTFLACFVKKQDLCCVKFLYYRLISLGRRVSFLFNFLFRGGFQFQGFNPPQENMLKVFKHCDLIHILIKKTLESKITYCLFAVIPIISVSSSSKMFKLSSFLRNSTYKQICLQWYLQKLVRVLIFVNFDFNSLNSVSKYLMWQFWFLSVLTLNYPRLW